MFLSGTGCHGDFQINGSPDVTKWVLIINLIIYLTENNNLAEKMIYIPHTWGAKIGTSYPDFDN